MKTIALDFDGVIHKYSKGWQDGSIYDKPFDGVFEKIRLLMDEGFAVFVLSTRRPSQIKEWLQFHCMVSEYEAEGIGHDPTLYKYTRYGFTVEKIPFWKKFWNKTHVLGITNKKLPAIFYVDDRAVKFDGDWNNTIKELISNK